MATTLRDVMTTDLLTATTSDTVADAARLMREGDVGDVLMVDDRGTLKGILTDRDVVVRVIAEGMDPATTKLEDVATDQVHCMNSGDSVDDAVALMRERAIRRIPVVHDGSPVGMVTLGDLARTEDKTSALADISASPPNGA